MVAGTGWGRKCVTLQPSFLGSDSIGRGNASGHGGRGPPMSRSYRQGGSTCRMRFSKYVVAFLELQSIAPMAPATMRPLWSIT